MEENNWLDPFPAFTIVLLSPLGLCSLICHWFFNDYNVIKEPIYLHCALWTTHWTWIFSCTFWCRSAVIWYGVKWGLRPAEVYMASASFFYHQQHLISASPYSAVLVLYFRHCKTNCREGPHTETFSSVIIIKKLNVMTLRNFYMNRSSKCMWQIFHGLLLCTKGSGVLNCQLNPFHCDILLWVSSTIV